MSFRPFLMKIPAHKPHNVPNESWYTLTIDSGGGLDEGAGALEDGEAYGRGGASSACVKECKGRSAAKEARR